MGILSGQSGQAIILGFGFCWVEARSLDSGPKYIGYEPLKGENGDKVGEGASCYSLQSLVEEVVIQQLNNVPSGLKAPFFSGFDSANPTHERIGKPGEKVR